MIIITDILKKPFDEGAKVATSNLIERIKTTTTSSFIVSINSPSKLPCIDLYFQLNKLLFNLNFYNTIRKQENTTILYIPAASGTLFSIIRAKLLSLFTGKDIFILALQPRKYSLITQCIVRLIPPKSIITQSNKTAKYLTKLRIENTTLPLGVDDKKYYPFSPLRIQALRKKYTIDQDKKVLLHVGHIQNSRNLDWLVDIKRTIPDIIIIVIGSTFNQDDIELFTKLQQANIRTIRDHISNMEEFYNLADYYIFPVLRNDGAIETPLSVIEAMACNLPIITTKFGSLTDTFDKDSDFHYVNNVEEIINILEQQRIVPCKNRKKTSPFTWEEIVKKLINIVEY